MILFLGTMSLLTGFLMVGCRHLQSLGNPQEFYFVGISHFTAEPLRKISDPSALVQTYSITSYYQSRFLPLPGASQHSSPGIAGAFLLAHLSTPSPCHQLCLGRSASVFHAAMEHQKVARQWKALSMPLPQPAGCLRATVCLGHLCKRNSKGSKCRESDIITTQELERTCQHEDRE